MSTFRKLISALVVAPCFAFSGAFAATVNIDVFYSATSTPTEEQRQAMDTAVDIWEYLLPEYQETATPTVNLDIDANIGFIDGPGGILGSAGPRLGRFSDSGNNFYSTFGVMNFEAVDLAPMSFVSQVALFAHEMAHVLGYGTLWDFGPYDLTDASGSASREYTGAAGLAAYQAEVDAAATFVPLEQFGGPGTAGGHWDERDQQNPTPTFFDDELMSGFLNVSPSLFISETTVASFEDLGFATRDNYSAMTLDELIAAVSVAPIPLPAGLPLLLVGLGSFAWLGRRKTA